MTVENDGLPLDEFATHGPDSTDVGLPSPAGTGVVGHVTDPPTDLLPLPLDQANVDALATAVPLAVLPAPMPPVGATADQPTRELPLNPPAGLPAPADSTTDGSLEGDLFDGIADR